MGRPVGVYMKFRGQYLKMRNEIFVQFRIFNGINYSSIVIRNVVNPLELDNL